MAVNLTSLILVPVGLAAVLLIGGLLAGIDRRLTARLQARQGPPLTQAWWDVVKLFGKRTRAVNPWQPFCARISFAAAATALVLLCYAVNLLLILFVSATAGAFLVFGAMSSLSPWSQTGAQRQLWQLCCCEALLFAFAAGVYLVSGGFAPAALFAESQPLLLRAPLLFAAMLVVLAITMKKSPFDLAASHHAHQELGRGVYSEYGGADLAWLEMAHWLETVLVLALCGLFWATDPFAMIFLAALSFFLVILLDNVVARLTWRWLAGRVLPAALVGAGLTVAWLAWSGP